MIICSKCGELAELTTPEKPHHFKYETFYKCDNPRCTNTSIVDTSLSSIKPINFEDATYEKICGIREKFRDFWEIKR